MSKIVIYVICLFITIPFVFPNPDENFYEELDIVPLSNGFVSATFKFLTLHHGSFGSHYDVFPKAIGEIVQRYGVDEFHLSMSQNFWRTYQWGYQPSPAVPTGAQLWAWFNENTTTGKDTQWRDFVHAMSGLFCASFSQIDTRRLTLQPENEFRPRGVLAEKESKTVADNHFLRYAVLPNDNVCTENLTPWKKLLPCKSLAGIGSLLTGTKIFSGHYNSLGVDLRRVCGGSESSCKNVSWELTLTLTVVFDLAYQRGDWSWDVASLFGSKIGAQCGVAESSKIFVDIGKKPPKLYLNSEHNSKLSVSSPSNYTDTVSQGNGHRYAAFDVNSILEKNGQVQLWASYPKAPSTEAASTPPIHIHNFVAGSGLQNGRLVSRIFNNLDVKVPILYSHSIPWFLRVYYHTLEISCGKKIIKPMFIVYQPARDRKRSHYFEIAFDLPPSRNSWCDLSMKFDRALLRYGEYPPDANHGFSVPAPMISFYSPTRDNHLLLLNSDAPLLTFSCFATNDRKKPVSKSAFTVVFGKSLLVNLPTPDFSMPYNVICLVCTVVALAFGPIHSLTTKTLTLTEANEKKKVGWNHFIAEIFSKIWNCLRKKLRIDRLIDLKNKLLRRKPRVTAEEPAKGDNGGAADSESKKDQ